VESSSALVEDYEGKIHLLRDLYPEHHHKTVAQRAEEDEDLPADLEEAAAG